MMVSPKTRISKWLVRAVLILNSGLALSYIGLWAITARQGQFWRADFSAYYTGWAMVRDGKGSQIYNFDLESQYQRNILGGRSFAEGLLPFNNPPHVALVFVPLSYLSLQQAYMAWTLIQAGLFIYLSWILYKLAKNWSPGERGMLLITAAALPSMLINYLLGAYSLLMLICLLQFTDCLRRNRPIKVGCWFMIGMLKPQVLVLPGVVLLAARRWRALFFSLLGIFTLFLLSSLVLGWNTWPDFLHQLQAVTNFFGKYGIDPRDMYNFRGTLALLLGIEHANLINGLSILALFGCVMITIGLWKEAWQPDHPDFKLRMALTLSIGSLFNLHANPQDGLLLIAPATLFYDYLQSQGLSRQACATFLTLCPITFLVYEFTVGSRLGFHLPVLAVIVLTIWIAATYFGGKGRSEAVLGGGDDNANYLPREPLK
jgi:hypothetical protein